MHGRDRTWNSVGFIHRQCQHTWHTVIRTSSSKRTAARPRSFTEPQSVVTRSEIVQFLMIPLHFVLEILRSSTLQFFSSRVNSPFWCFPWKLELCRISFSLCGLSDHFFKVFNVFCQVRGSFWPAFILHGTVLLGFSLSESPSKWTLYVLQPKDAFASFPVCFSFGVVLGTHRLCLALCWSWQWVW